MKRKYELEESIKQIKLNPGNNKNFIRQLTNSNLYTPVRNINEDIKGTSLIFNTLVDNKNDQYLIFFTNIDEIRINEGLSKQEIIEISYYDIVTIIFDQKSTYCGFVINPFSDSIIVDKDDIYQINNRTAFSEPAFVEENAIFGVPIKYPKTEFEFIKQYLKSIKSVNSVYFTLMQQGSSENYVFIVEHDSEFDKLKPEIFNTISFYLPKEINICVIESDDKKAKEAVKNSMLIYKKE